MENIKRQLQNIGENLAHQSKIYLKSHDLSIFLQLSLLSIPLILTLISFYLSGCSTIDNLSKILDYFSFGISILALIYYVYFGKNTELYRSWGEKYLVLYKEVENYFKLNLNYEVSIIESFIEKQNQLGLDNNKPNIHFCSKKWTDKVIEKEMKYGNEDVVWWK
ncbi:MAG: hypothetical protein PHF46_00185 [Candidatus Gracilibacteria bacterium]|nr:hypothetical protein [Candidatus Gracilibacteria bacterium]MDD4531061.1 hypothetical protein [Candidatus Gracilibacteria bacterium]